MTKFNKLKGKILTKIEVGIEEGSYADEMIFTTNTQDDYILYHKDDWCEKCNIVDIVGDIKDLIDTPILLAEEVTNRNCVTPKETFNIIIKEDEERPSFTWTFYKLGTIKGYVTISWYGTSNGYYNETVSFRKRGDGSKYGPLIK